jgi:alpha-tubulin suppressor-like RCC1 family protein
LTPVQVVTGFSSVLGRVAAGEYHTATVMADGTVRAFGNNNRGQLGVNDTTTRLTPVQVFGISSSATAVACGNYFTAVLLADGTVRTFGLNANGQLGVNDNTTRLTPVTVLNITSATAVACGFRHTAVLLADGTVRTFGRNEFGQLGVNDTTTRQTPVQVFGISSSATAVACGHYHTAVLLADGTVRMFGDNTYGQLGINAFGGTRQTPVQVSGITSGTAVAGGEIHSVVLLADGTVRAFGYNFYGQLGVNDTTNRPTPVTVLNITSATAVACGRAETLVLLADGTVRACGRNGNGALGVGDLTQRNTPVQVFGISSSATAIAGGWFHTIVLLADGSLRTVGRNNNGHLGVADTVNRLIPVKVGVSGNKVAGGFYFTAVVSNDGTLRTFGSNQFGQLGLGDTASRLTPVQVTGLTSAIATACGAVFTAVVLNDGTVRTFGRNNNGQLGINLFDGTRQTPVTVVNISTATAVACGSDHAAVLLADGTVRTFGINNQGQLGIDVNGGTRQTPVQVFGISSSAVAVACGGLHTAVLLADGTVRTFGYNLYGQLGINVSGGGQTRQTPVQVWGISSSATTVSCGQDHTIVLLADGTVRTFGSNGQGQLGINVTGGTRSTAVQVFGISSSATFVNGGLYHTAVLLVDGTIRTFGGNSKSQLGIDVTGGTRQTPVQVFGISSSATFVTGGLYHTAILLQDGTVRTFGGNGSGELGVNDTTNRLTPVQVIAAGAVVAPLQGKVAMGRNHTVTIMSNGTVQAIGRNTSGELGVGDNTPRQTPVQVLNITSAVQVATGGYQTSVLLADGTVRTFGINSYGGLGINSTSNQSVPQQVWGMSSSATAVAVGNYYAAVLLANGTVRTFGFNNAGQLGVNDITSRLTPVQVLNITSATAIACGAGHTVTLLSNGTVWAFGNNNLGQLGVNDTTSRLTPVQVWGISSSATAVACGGSHTAVLLADGTVRTFGYNPYGNLGVNDTTNRPTAVQVFGISSSATAVACGAAHTAVLLGDGTVRTFGANNFGGLGINVSGGSRLTPVQVFGISSSAVAIGTCGLAYHTAVLLTDGTVRTFGRNDYGQLGVNDTTSRLTPVTVLNITTAVTPAPITFLTGATAIVIPLSSASTPITSFLLSTAAIITYPFIQFPALNLGPVTYPQYQLELTTDYARKLTTSTWTIGSDERLKTDIETANVDRCVEIVQNLDLKRFAWNFPDGSGVNPTDSHSLGWIAQEFAQFFPRSVDEAPAHGIMDFKNLNSDQIIKVMWGALKKLRADLKSRKSSDSELSTAGDNASPTPE